MKDKLDLPLTAEERNAILGGNAERLLGAHLAGKGEKSPIIL